MIGASSFPQGGGAILGAANWVEGLIQSPAVTGIAILAIAAAGLSMLSGHIQVRRGLTVALGCFILFGASAIARGIVGSVSAVSSTDAPSLAWPPPQPTPIANAPVPAVPPPVADPYAGASIR
jgi:type IV secretory pathway VirB2 component (pilin)